LWISTRRQRADALRGRRVVSIVAGLLRVVTERKTSSGGKLRESGGGGEEKISFCDERERDTVASQKKKLKMESACNKE